MINMKVEGRRWKVEGVDFNQNEILRLFLNKILLFFVLISSTLILLPSAYLYPRSYPMLLNPEQVLNKDYLIIDARNEINFLKGHIKGAIHLDGGCSGKICYKKGDLPCVLKPINEIKKILEEKGICKDKKIVIYGDENSWGAEGRIYWLLDKLGYKKISILNGGYNYWKSKRYPISFGISLFSKSKKCKNNSINHFKLVTAEDIHKFIKEKKAIIIDTRTLKEYNGAILYGEKRGGHIPGAIHIYWKDFLNKDYTLKTKNEILNILKEHGIPLPENIHKKIITVCTGGVRSGFVYFVLKYVGYKDVENYDYGMWQWAMSEFEIEK